MDTFEGILSWFSSGFTSSATCGFLLLLLFCCILWASTWTKDTKVSHILKSTSNKTLDADFLTDRKRGDSEPPAYPNGWYALLESLFLGNGRVKTITAIGQDFVVFRGTEGGEVFVLDAFCPHLGAHLGYGSQISGNCITCPFHGWCFDGRNGQCVSVPYAKKAPEFVSVKRWPSCEKNGFIFVWFHSEAKEPQWFLPDICELKQKWDYIGKTEHRVHCHIQDIAENGADLHHLNQIHSESAFSGGKIEKHPGWLSSFLATSLRHEWRSTWCPPPDASPTQHIATVQMSHTIKFFGMSCPWFDVQLHIEQIGPSVVHMHWQSSKKNEGVFVQCVTPTGEPLKQRVVHHLYASRSTPRVLARIYLHILTVMLERDIAIWDRKRFVKHPKWVAEDASIVRFRRWFAQFYSSDRCTLNW